MRIAVAGGRVRSLVRQRGPLLRALVAAGHDVLGVAPAHDAGGADELAAMGVRLALVPMSRHGTDPIEDARLVGAFAALYRRERPDLVLHTTIKPIVYGTLGAVLARVPRRYALVTGLGAAFAERPTLRGRVVGGVARGLYAVAARGVDRMIFQNADDPAWFVELGILPDLDRVAVVHGSGVDMADFARQPLPDGPPVFLWMGRLLRDKGLVELVDAWRPLREDAGGAELRVLGLFDPGHPQALTEAEVAAWHDEGVIRFLGSAQDVRPHLAAAHALVLPSYREGTPRAVLEAMATGRAIVTSDAPGCRQTIVHGREGFVVPVGRSEPLREALRRLVHEPGLLAACADAAWHRCAERYAADAVAASMLRAMDLAA